MWFDTVMHETHHANGKAIVDDSSMRIKPIGFSEVIGAFVVWLGLVCSALADTAAYKQVTRVRARESLYGVVRFEFLLARLHDAMERQWQATPHYYVWGTRVFTKKTKKKKKQDDDAGDTSEREPGEHSIIIMMARETNLPFDSVVYEDGRLTGITMAPDAGNAFDHMELVVVLHEDEGIALAYIEDTKLEYVKHSASGCVNAAHGRGCADAVL